jgi:hypothetical protein
MTKCGFCRAEGDHTIRNCDSQNVETLFNKFKDIVVADNWFNVYRFVSGQCLKNVRMISIKTGGNSTGNKSELVRYIMNHTYRYIPGAPWYEEKEDEDILSGKMFDLWLESFLEYDEVRKEELNMVLYGYYEASVDGLMKDVYIKYIKIAMAYRLTQYTPMDLIRHQEQQERDALALAEAQAQAQREAADALALAEAQAQAQREAADAALDAGAAEALAAEEQQEDPTLRLNTISCNLKSLKNKVECSVCLETCTVRMMGIINCKHEFCIDCISKTIKSSSLKKNCPLCREPIKSVNLRLKSTCRQLYESIVE